MHPVKYLSLADMVQIKILINLMMGLQAGGTFTTPQQASFEKLNTMRMKLSFTSFRGPPLSLFEKQTSEYLDKYSITPIQGWIVSCLAIKHPNLHTG